MTNDHEMGLRLRSWLHETTVKPPDAHGSVRQVVARLPEPDDAGGRWPMASLSRRSVSVAGGFPRVGGFSMFGALKLVVAAAIVALFGGFVLSGVLTTPVDDQRAPAAVTAPPSSMTTDELLSGMVTDEVEPGVLRIVNDGYRDLWHPDMGSDPVRSPDVVAVGGSGAVWRITPDHRFFRLGEEATWGFEPDVMDTSDPDVMDMSPFHTEVGPDGRLWTVTNDEDLLVFDGEAWTDGGLCCDPWAVAFSGDGTMWALGDQGLMWTRPGGEGFATSDWADVYEGEALELAASDDGAAWLPGLSFEGDIAVPTFLHFDGSAWQVVPAPDGAFPVLTFDVGPDGTVWAGADTSMPHRNLARLDDAGWTVFTGADGVPAWGHWQQMGPPSPIAELEVAPDGSPWLNAAGCNGLARFDGQTWTPYLAGSCISDFDIAPDGTVWAVARSQEGSAGVDTYVIRPEVVATVE